MNILIKTKLKAAAFHLAASGLLVSLYLAIVHFQWYPYPFFIIENTWEVIWLIIAIDLVLGPLLTLIVYRPNKPNLKFDLSAIILIQLSALSWGAWTTFDVRPAYVVFDNGRATILNHKEVSRKAIEDPRLLQSNRAGPQLVFLRPANSQEEFKEQMDLAFAGTDPIYQEKFYNAIDEHKETLLAQGIDIEKRMEEHPQLAASVKQYLQKNNRILTNVAFFLIRGRNENSIIILSRPEAEIIGHLDFSLE